MRFVVYGAGAIGGLVAALLAEHGAEVVVIGRGGHADAMERSGLVVETSEGRRTFHLDVARNPRQAGIGPDDFVLLAMKSQDTMPALMALRDATASSTPVACLQNGVENERAALRLFENVYGVCVMCPAAHLEPGVVQAFSHPTAGLLDVGRYPTGTDELSASLAGAFRSASFESHDESDIMRWKYRKLILNLGNAVEAVCEPPARNEISRLARGEGEACLQAAGIEPASAEEDAARRSNLLTLHPIGGQQRGGGSSWQSLERGTGSIESDYLNGEIVLLGRQHGAATPVNALLQELAAEAASSRARPGSISRAEFFERLSAAAPS